MNKENPFSKIIEAMREEGAVNNPPSITLATVASTNPINIFIGKLPLDGDNLYFADYLHEGYKRNVTLNGGVESELEYKDSLTVGDVLAVMPTADRQQYIVLARVVRA